VTYQYNLLHAIVQPKLQLFQLIRLCAPQNENFCRRFELMLAYRERTALRAHHPLLGQQMSTSPTASEKQPTVCMALYSFDVGGSERLGIRLISHYLRSGLNVVCCATKRGYGPLSAELEKLGIKNIAFSLEQRGRLSRLLPHNDICHWLRENYVSCIHAQHFGVYSDIFGPACAAGIKHQIITEHTAEPILNDHAYARLTRKLAPKARHVVAINKVVQSAICQVTGLPHSKVTIIQNGIDTTRFVPIEKSGNDPIRIVWLGRLHPDKDILTALQTFRVALKSNPALNLTIVGDGEERSKAERFVQAHGLGAKVTFRGEVTDPLSSLQQADIFLMSSVTEGTPFALLEALSCGLPVVATAVGGIPDVISPDVGILAPARDPMALSKGITKLAEDGELRTQMGINARQLAISYYSEERMARDYIKLIELLNDEGNY
jgi:glycosyltransferase involved in cell wall biosynthesis